MRSLVVALVLLAGAACGKYGPPVRSADETSAAAPAVSAPPTDGNTEECPDPNSAAPAAGQTP
jgi:predicted small lipoprotein YifL